MPRKNDRVCVSRYYPIDHIKANRMYIVRYSNVLFIANGNIYVQVRRDNDEKYYCCTIHNFRKWGGMENFKRYISLKEKKKVKTVSNLIDAVLECRYSRELDYFEFMKIEEDSLLENSDYKYSVDDFVFHRHKDFNYGFYTNGTGFREDEERIFHDGDINFSLDLGIGGLRKDLPECVLEEIKRETNRLLEVNFVKPEDIKNIKFTCYAKVVLNHAVNFKQKNIYKDGYHIFYRSYSIHIEIDKIGEYYNDFDLDDLDIKFLKHADFYLCDRSWTEKQFDEFIRDEIFR